MANSFVDIKDIIALFQGCVKFPNYVTLSLISAFDASTRACTYSGCFYFHKLILTIQLFNYFNIVQLKTYALRCGPNKANSHLQRNSRSRRFR